MLKNSAVWRRAAWCAALAVLAAATGSCGQTPAPVLCTLPIGETCASDTQCNDFIFCNGLERCAPGAAGASSCGCVRAAPPCSASLSCNEAQARCVIPGCENSDADGDGHSSVACGGDDCDDSDSTRFPGNTEICDATHDEDCNQTTYGLQDTDEDGHPDVRCCNGTICGTDCDDARAVVHPGAPDVCDGRDNDCNGIIDDGELANTYADVDGDGHGAGAAIRQCTSTPGFSGLNNDCDDSVAAIHPGAIRCTTKASEYELCQSDGGFVVGYCPAQAPCRAQPGGDGVCL